jgi:hypothetical protein
VTDIRTIVNSVGILLTMLGVYMIYVNSPINYTVIDGGEIGAGGPSWEETERKANRRNTLLKTGVYLVLAGSFVQLVSNFIPVGGSAA